MESNTNHNDAYAAGASRDEESEQHERPQIDLPTSRKKENTRSF